MKTNNNNPSGQSKELKCIWMTSQQVAYKLCDREFDCENCEFDKVFKNQSKKMTETLPQHNTNNDLLESIIIRIEDERFDENIIYLKNQLIMKNLFGNAYYLGINPIILSLIENVNSIQEFPGNDIKKDHIIFTLEGNWGKKDFFSPLNFLIIGKISITPLKFNQNKWCSVILFNNNEINNIQLSKDDWIFEKNHALTLLKNQLKNKPGIGKSLMDGGEPVRYLYQYLGKKEFLNLLDGIFL